MFKRPAPKPAPKEDQAGFSLLEMFVLIGIILILASVVLLALNSARSRARDAKRIADVREIVSALKLYQKEHGSYPLENQPTLAETVLYEPLVKGTPSYLTHIPTAPLPVDGSGDCAQANGPGIWNDYIYSSSADGSSFTLQFCIGGSVGNYAQGRHSADPNGIQ